MTKNCLSIGRFIMGLCFKIIEIWNLFDIWDFVYWNFWFIQVRKESKSDGRGERLGGAFDWVDVLTEC